MAQNIHQETNERCLVQITEKKQDQQSDDQDYDRNRQGNYSDMFQQDDFYHQKQNSDHLNEYLNFFNLPKGYLFKPPQIDQQIHSNLRKNGIRYVKQNLCQQPRIRFRKSSPSFSIVYLEVSLGYFTVSLNILNISEQMPRRTDLQGNEVQNDMKGNFGQILLIDWLQFLNSKYIIEIEQLRFQEDISSKKSVKCLQYQYATKIFYFPIKKLSPNQKLQYKYDKVYQMIIEYAYCKIASCFRIGLNTDHPFGFDLVFYKNCIQFFMQKGEYITQCESMNIDNIMETLKQKLLLLHSLHIVHRDLKYDNLMYSPTYNQIVFIDFGLTQSITENVGLKSKTVYKGSYYFLSDQVKKLMFQDQLINVDLYWNDAVGLIKTKNMIKSALQNPNISHYDISARQKYFNYDDRKQKRISQMKKYLQLQMYFAITRKFLDLNLKIIQKFEKTEYLSWISKWLQFTEGLQSCPMYDSFKIQLKKSLRDNSVFIKGFNQEKVGQQIHLLKQQFSNRYQLNLNHIKIQLNYYDDSWKLPIQKLCKQYMINKKVAFQFSILTYSASLLFNNIYTIAYVFKKLFSLFPQKILQYFIQNMHTMQGSFVMIKKGDKDFEKTKQKCIQSQRHMIIHNYLLEINKFSAVLLTKYIQERLLQFFKFQKKAYRDQLYQIQLADPNMEKYFFLQKQVKEQYLVEKTIFQKVLLLLFKIYIKESALPQSEKILVQKIKVYCSKAIYLKGCFQFSNTHVTRLSQAKTKQKIYEIQDLIKELRRQDQLLTANSTQKDNSQFNSQTKIQNKYRKDSFQKQFLNVKQFQLYMTKLKHQVLNHIDNNNAFILRQQIIKEGFPMLRNLRYKMQNEDYIIKTIQMLNLQVVCNVFLTNQFQNIEIIQKMHDLMMNLQFQRDVFVDLQRCHQYLNKNLGSKKNNKKPKFQAMRTKVDINSVIIQFEDERYFQKFNFNTFITDILTDHPKSKDKLTQKLRQTLRKLKQNKKWDDQNDNQMFIRKNYYILNYLSFSFTNKLTKIYLELKIQVIQNFQKIVRFINLNNSNIYLPDRKIQVKCLGSIIETFLDLKNQNEIISIQPLFQKFIIKVQNTWREEKFYPPLYWLSKITLLKILNFNIGENKVFQRVEQKFYQRMAHYYPLDQNNTVFFSISNYVLRKIKQRKDNQPLSELIQGFQKNIVCYILSNQMAFFLIKDLQFSKQILKHLVNNDNIKQFISVISLISKFVKKMNAAQNIRFYFDIVDFLCFSKNINIDNKKMNAISYQIQKNIKNQDGKFNYQIAEICVFQGCLFFYRTLEQMSEKGLKRLAMLLYHSSFQSKYCIGNIFYKMGAIHYKKREKGNIYNKFLKYDLRYSNYMKKQLLIDNLMNGQEYVFLSDLCTQEKNNEQIQSLQQKSSINIFRKKMLVKMSRLKLVHKINRFKND